MTPTPSLMAWLVEQLARGCTPGSVVQSMLDSGWSLADASEALCQAAALAGQGAGQGVGQGVGSVRAEPVPVDPARLPDLHPRHSHRIRAADRDVRVILDMDSPRVVVVADLLSPAECEALIAAARGRLRRSETVSAASESTAEVNAARTSEGMFFRVGEHEVVSLLEQRIAALFNWPVDQAEGMQVLRYVSGAQYRPHYDHFDVGSAGGRAAVAHGGQRVGTLVVYLATPDEGGATVFPEHGLKVHAHAGHAVFFHYDVSQGGAGVLHGGAEVVSGEKWVATKWLREKRFQ